MSHLDWDDDKLKRRMEEKIGTSDGEYGLCLDILLLRYNERLIDKTEGLVNETKALVKTTQRVALATWALAGVTIIVILIQFFSCK